MASPRKIRESASVAPARRPRVHDRAVDRDVVDDRLATIFGRVVTLECEGSMGLDGMFVLSRHLPGPEMKLLARPRGNLARVPLESGDGGGHIAVRKIRSTDRDPEDRVDTSYLARPGERFFKVCGVAALCKIELQPRMTRSGRWAASPGASRSARKETVRDSLCERGRAAALQGEASSAWVMAQ